MKPDEDVQVWLHRFNAYRVEQHWPDATAILELRKFLLLTDINVLNMLESFEPGYTFDRACWKIMQNHGFLTQHGSYGIAFQKRKQGANEAVVTYAAELHDLSRKAYPNNPPQQVFRDVFIAGLRNDNTRMKVLERNFGSATEAIELASQLEELEIAQRPQTAIKVAAVKAPSDPTPQPTNQVNAANFSRGNNRQFAPQRQQTAPATNPPARSNSATGNYHNRNQQPQQYRPRQQSQQQRSQQNRPTPSTSNHSADQQQRRNTPRQPTPDDLCRNCGGRGHFIKDCPSPRFF
jgi:hypothetical protein